MLVIHPRFFDTVSLVVLLALAICLARYLALMRMDALMPWTATLRLSPPVYKLGGRELCVVFSCVVSGCTVLAMSALGRAERVWSPEPLPGVNPPPHSAP